MMTLGRRFSQGILNVYDDGSIRNLRGHHPVRRRGHTRSPQLADPRWRAGRAPAFPPDSGQDGRELSPGNVRAVSYRFAPIVRMTNTAIDNGTATFEDMINDIKRTTPAMPTAARPSWNISPSAPATPI